MGNAIVKTQMEDVKNFLGNTVSVFEDFLNETTVSGLLSEEQGNKDYYKQVLSNIRKLLVYCEEGLDACNIIILGEPFQKGAAEKTLYRIYHQCVEEFFSPKNDTWFENSRSAYTGKNSIRFHEPVPHSVQNLFQGLESDFQHIREELEYYETDYRTKMIQSR
ncbi:YpuI family protein [Cytobacillus gottheilii]|uniref:YpuI family protein n=1 Tax=Cytobacillus gottheilii TaxID=859144 RepID=A0ABX8F7Y6_9BACI|nr:YpuI family protein [Cytobacillus gottheilii]QVY60220.1 YpuI family protein [Cytobacillus gottheilii]